MKYLQTSEKALLSMEKIFLVIMLKTRRISRSVLISVAMLVFVAVGGSLPYTCHFRTQIRGRVRI